MRKDPALACLLNLLLVGTGHMYLGQVAKGIVIMALGVVLGVPTMGILAVPLVIWAMYDAHRIAKKMNQAETKPLAAGGREAEKGVE